MGYIVTLLIARSLGPAALGVIAFGLSATSLLGVMSGLGLLQAHVKIAAEGRNLPECIGTFLFLQVALTGIALLVAIVGSMWVLPSYAYDEQVVLGILLASFLLGNLIRVSDLTFAAQQETAKQQMPVFLGNVVLVITVWTALQLGAGVIGAALAYLFKTMVWGSWSFWMFRTYAIHKPSWAQLKRYFHFALPLMAASILGIVTINIDGILIRMTWSTRELGYYFAAQRLVSGLALLADAIAVVLMPSMSAHFASGQVGSLMDLGTRTRRYLVLATLPIASVTIALAQPILAILLGQQFVEATVALQLLTVYTFFRIVNQPYSDLILASDKASVVGRIGVAFALTALLLYPILIPKDLLGLPTMGWGAVGAAASQTLAIIMNSFLFTHYARRLYGRSIQSFPIQPLLWSATVGLGLYIIANQFPIGWLELIGLGGLGLLLCYGGLVVLGLLTRSDLALLVQLLDPKTMLSYVRAETRAGG